MAQNFTDNVPNASHNWDDDLSKMADNFAALKSCFSGPSAPANPVAGLPWVDTANHLLKVRNEANTAWLSVWDLANNKPIIANLSAEITLAMMAASCSDPAAGTAGLRSLGTGATQACAGNDPRLGQITGDRFLDVTAGTEITIANALTERNVTETTYTKKKSTTPINRSGTVTVSFTLHIYAKYGISLGGRIYVDDVATGTERILDSGTQTYTENISITSGQSIQIYCKLIGGLTPAKVSNLIVTANDPYIARELKGY